MSRAVSLWVVRLGRGTVRAEVAPARRSDDSRELQKNATESVRFRALRRFRRREVTVAKKRKI
jgi:hypothetical protein